jgi:hypothetical protein
LVGAETAQSWKEICLMKRHWTGHSLRRLSTQRRAEKFNLFAEQGLWRGTQSEGAGVKLEDSREARGEILPVVSAGE